MSATALEAAARLLGALGERNAPLGARTTYRVGGTAGLLVTAASESTLSRVRTAVMETNVPVLVLGLGSNMLVAEAGFPGIVVVLEDDGSDVSDAEGEVTAHGSRSLPVFARSVAARGLGGMEWAVGIPGSVGGAVRMNAGGHGSDIATNLVRWTFYDLLGGPHGERDVAALGASYRHTNVAAHHVVTSATFRVEPKDSEAAKREIDEIVRWRRENQPGGQNAGSVFTNPDGDSAGRIIESIGCKGLRIGSAEVSPKHANFIQADPGGSADDVRALILEVQRRVRDETGIELRTEIRMIGFES